MRWCVGSGVWLSTACQLQGLVVAIHACTLPRVRGVARALLRLCSTSEHLPRASTEPPRKNPRESHISDTFCASWRRAVDAPPSGACTYACASPQPCPQGRCHIRQPGCVSETERPHVGAGRGHGQAVPPHGATTHNTSLQHVMSCLCLVRFMACCPWHACSAEHVCDVLLIGCPMHAHRCMRECVSAGCPLL